MKRLKKIAIWVGAILLFVVLSNILVYHKQEYLTFFPMKLDKNHQFDFQVKFSEGSIVVDEDIEISFVKFPAAGKRKGVVFHTHGNAGNMQTSAGGYQFWVEQGYDYIIWDYEEFGKSTGDLEEDTFLETASFVFKKLTSSYSKGEIILQGHSLGTSVTLFLAKEYEVSKVVLLAPFYNVVEMAKFRFPVADWMITFPLMSNEFIKEVEEPILIFHGDKDKTVPYEQGLELSKEREGVCFITLSGAPHSRLEQIPLYKIKVLEFIGSNNFCE